MVVRLPVSDGTIDLRIFVCRQEGQYQMPDSGGALIMHSETLAVRGVYPEHINL